MADRYSKFTKILAVSLAALALSGCAARKGPVRSIDEIYDEVHRKGGQDAVSMLRAGMRERMVYGVADPYVPLRTPDEVVPIWVPPYEEPRTGRRIDGHWEHTVTRRGEWFTE
ncbi:conjugal transfer protein [Sinimarinibacterium sp. CAU 1509]|uniref:conjugal transfer protein n=1 Tax=Sinimarinibacterium sp. CAU 1509 TaxID=2562283 RepID=UPI0010ABA929|nr:conjugal transfer protein [Sinimarinibacterium sp. CAU 1509]TJY57362.1 conjugal transfer protein [Sinimarinibacterium sp. CAU 1509]